MNVRNIVKKMAASSADEILFRSKKIIKDLYDQKNYKKEQQRLRDTGFKFWNSGNLSILPEKEELHLPQIWNRQFFLDTMDRQKTADFFKQHFATEYKVSLERADQILQNKLRFLGIEVTYPNGFDWHRDPLSDFRYPLKYYKNIPIFGGNRGQGDVKHIWEVNRHQFLIELGKAYFLTGDEKYAQKIVDTFLDWYEKNPYKAGINWTSALEVAVRSLAWIWAFAFIRTARAFTPHVNFILQKALHQHARYLSQNLSFYFSPYNHLIGETTALFIINYLFPHFRNAHKQATRAWKILEKEITRQFHTDGMTVEQASYYHHFTLGFYMQAVLLRQLNGDAVGQATMSRLEKAVDIMMYLTRPDGTIPRMGEIDDGLAIYFSDAANWDFRSFLNMGALLFNRPDMKFVGGRFQENAFWLFGMAGFKRYADMQAVPPTDTVKYFRESGYLTIRSGWNANADFFVMDVGPLAAGVRHDEIPSAAHGHMDLTAFELHIHGKPVFVDAGHYTYNGPWEWAHYFRRTEAHNTLTVDGQSLAVNKQAMKISHAPHVDVQNYYSEANLVTLTVEHDGYRRLDAPVMHRRTFVFLSPDIWLFWDHLDGDQPHHIQLHYHLHQDVKDVKLMENGFRVGMPRAETALRILYPDFRFEKRRGGKNPADGWLGENYGLKLPAWYVRAAANLHLPQEVLSLIFKSTETGEKSPKISEIKTDDKIKRWDINSADWMASVILSPGGNFWRWEQLQTDARFAIVRVLPDKRKRCYLWNFTQASIGAKQLTPSAGERVFKVYEY